MENFLRIITVADNIPIVVILFASFFFIWLSFSKARRNDKLIRGGRKDKIVEEMEK